MSHRSLIVAAGGVTAALAIVAAHALAHLPPGAMLPVHWDAGGTADRFAPARTALFRPVLLCAGLSLMFLILPRIEPLQHRLHASRGLYRASWAALLAMMAVVEATAAAPAFGIALPALLPLAATGLMLIVIGNALPKSRPGFFVGIRTPWTLTDPDNWIATHRLGSKTMMAGGAIILLSAVLPIPADARHMVTLTALAIAVVPPVVFSYVYWRRGRA